MNKRQIRLEDRRERLIERVATQRTILADNIQPWRMRLLMIDQGLIALRLVRLHPLWMAGGMALFSTLRQGRAGKWLWCGLITWRVVTELRGKRRA